MADRTEVLTAPLVIEYPFSRTTGPVIGAFLTGLREQVIVGTKTSDGRVLVPPMEYDPVTVTATGLWRGTPVRYRHTFSNTCVLHTETGPVFAM